VAAREKKKKRLTPRPKGPHSGSRTRNFMAPPFKAPKGQRSSAANPFPRGFGGGGREKKQWGRVAFHLPGGRMTTFNCFSSWAMGKKNPTKKAWDGRSPQAGPWMELGRKGFQVLLDMFLPREEAGSSGEREGSTERTGAQLRRGSREFPPVPPNHSVNNPVQKKRLRGLAVAQIRLKKPRTPKGGSAASWLCAGGGGPFFAALPVQANSLGRGEGRPVQGARGQACSRLSHPGVIFVSRALFQPKSIIHRASKKTWRAVFHEWGGTAKRVGAGQTK